MSLTSPALAGQFFTTSATWEAPEWSKDLNVRLDTIKLLEKNTGRTLLDISHSNVLLQGILLTWGSNLHLPECPELQADSLSV